ncbi:hypothetical protein MKW94_026041 [Papaver nudicaule]|uniref:Uncharacterized protein n=1 Tax=Papaver nudicaule TaxID=74823 RepID=A0AA41S773_PAPNU|nr:hypothetical protein [Papaver nudicaule]
MVVDSAAREAKLRKARQEYLVLRGKLKERKPYLYVKDDILAYVLLLNRTSGMVLETKSQVLAEVEYLKNLLAELEDEHAEAKRDRFPVRLSYLYAQRRKSMMLQEMYDILVKGKEIPDDFRRWIRQQLQDKDWIAILRDTNAAEDVLIRPANAEGVQLIKETINVEPIEDDNPELVKERFMVTYASYIKFISYYM